MAFKQNYFAISASGIVFANIINYEHLFAVVALTILVFQVIRQLTPQGCNKDEIPQYHPWLKDSNGSYCYHTYMMG
jgi:hypothetical protein